MKIAKGKEQEYKDWYEKTVIHTVERVLHMLKMGWNDGREDRSIRRRRNEVIVDNAKQLSYEADRDGITGFMYGAAVSILSQYWEYGECLRKWHNKDYGYDGDGVVNRRS